LGKANEVIIDALLLAIKEFKHNLYGENNWSVVLFSLSHVLFSRSQSLVRSAAIESLAKLGVTSERVLQTISDTLRDDTTLWVKQFPISWFFQVTLLFFNMFPCLRSDVRQTAAVALGTFGCKTEMVLESLLNALKQDSDS
jgi:HEAT repeat protein